jgi:hypothetical protein
MIRWRGSLLNRNTSPNRSAFRTFFVGLRQQPQVIGFERFDRARVTQPVSTTKDAAFGCILLESLST